MSGRDGNQRGGALGGKVPAQPAEFGDADYGEPGPVAVAALPFSDGRGQVRLDRRGREQGSDDVPAALVEDAGQAHLGGQRVPGGAGGADAGGQGADVGLGVDQVDQRHQHAALGAKPGVDGLHRHAGLAGDVGHRAGGVPLPGEQVAGGVQDVAAGLVGHGLAAIRVRTRHLDILTFHSLELDSIKSN